MRLHLMKPLWLSVHTLQSPTKTFATDCTWYDSCAVVVVLASRRRRMRVRVEWRCATSCSSDGVSRQSLLTPGALAAVPPCLCGGWSCVSRDAVAPCALPRLTAL
jgi:hypothetical protein